MIKKYDEFVIDETDEFYESLEFDKRKLKLLPKFKSTIEKAEILDNFTLGEIKKKFKPVVKQQKKRITDNGIF
jgi:hypothetical protein